EDGHAGQLYELTGPRLMTFEEAVGEIARATGRPIRYVPISIDEYKLLLTEYQVPADFVWLVEYLFTKVLDGRNAHLADRVRPARGAPGGLGGGPGDCSRSRGGQGRGARGARRRPRPRGVAHRCAAERRIRRRAGCADTRRSARRESSEVAERQARDPDVRPREH